MKKINYYLRKNPLSTSDENLYTAMVRKKETLRQEDVINAMLGKNTTVTRQDIIVVLDLLKETVTEQILSGYPVNTDLFKAGISIRGGFLSTSDEFDDDRHRVCVNMNASPSFKRELAFLSQVERVDPRVTAPVIRQIFDFASGGFSTHFAPGGLVEIKGSYLKADGAETRVFLEREGAEELIPVQTVHRASERGLLCTLPADLEGGSYRVMVILGEGDHAPRGTYDSPVSIG